MVSSLFKYNSRKLPSFEKYNKDKNKLFSAEQKTRHGVLLRKFLISLHIKTVDSDSILYILLSSIWQVNKFRKMQNYCTIINDCNKGGADEIIFWPYNMKTGSNMVIGEINGKQHHLKTYTDKMREILFWKRLDCHSPGAYGRS